MPFNSDGLRLYLRFRFPVGSESQLAAQARFRKFRAPARPIWPWPFWPAHLALARLAGPFGRSIWPAHLALARLAGLFWALAEVTTKNAGPEHF